MSSSPKDQFIDKALSQQKQEHRFRELNSFETVDAALISDGDRQFINFSGNDYLGLAQHPEVIGRSADYARKYGAGATASRLITGTLPIHDQLEQKLASTFGWQAALLFNSGFQANSTIISTIADRHSLILADKLSHNSLLQGSLLSRATLRRFEHNDISDLEDHLKNASSEDYSRIIVITESIFSMDGDRSDLQSTAELCEEYNAWLFVDDAHAVGVWGKKGLGLAQGIQGIDMVLGTCGKAFGSFGAYLLCSERMRDFLINFCPGFIYTTALPPAVIGAIDASLELLTEMKDERNRLHNNINRLKAGIQKAGFDTGNSESQIIPIMVGGDQETIELADYLQEQGFLAKAIRPPTVPEGSARIRISLSSNHTEKQIDNFLSVLNTWKND